MGHEGLAPVACLFSSDRVRELAVDNGAFLTADSVLGNAIAAGEAKRCRTCSGILNDFPRCRLVRTLLIDEALIRAFLNLRDLLDNPKIRLTDLEKDSAWRWRASNRRSI